MSDLRDSLVQSGTLIGYLNTIVYAHNYNDLSNKPQINGVTLQGNKTASEIGLVTPATEAVQSVNGETGNVVLDGNNIAYNNNNTINQRIDAVAASIPVNTVTSVNGETGDVVLDGSDIRYDANYTVSAKIAAVEGAIPAVPVQSVNGETGAVVLDGDDIEYSAGVTVNDKIDAVEAAIPVVSYPVTSVNGETGAVVLDGADIEYSAGVTVNDQINTVDGKTTTNATAIGNLSNLTTSDKSSVVGAVNEINAVTTINIATTGYSDTGIDLIKANKVVQFNFSDLRSLASGVYTTIGQVPNEYKPKKETICDVIDHDNRQLRFRVNTNGDVRVYNYGTAITSNNNTFITFTYITA